jgi:ferredoxin
VSGDGLSALLAGAAERLLSEGTVEVVVGFETGSIPMRATPCLITDPADTGRLAWNAFCANNLAKYLEPGRKAAIVAKGCDTRAIVELVKENRLKREDLVVIGVPCRGMADPSAIARRLPGIRISGVDESDGALTVHGGPAPVSVPLSEVLHRSCLLCASRNPVICDIPAGDPVEENDPGFPDVEAFAALPADARRARVEAEMSKCLRCYACRSACPLCTCASCFADSSQPQWVGRGTHPEDVTAFHVMRAMHLAGRCVECGACARACPTGVDLSILNRRLAADVAELFGCRAGLDEGAPQPLAAYSMDDSQDFILDPGRRPE